VSYGFVLRSEARAVLGRMRASDPGGAKLVVAAVRLLADHPRPEGVHVLSEAEGLYVLHLSRLDAATRVTTQYRVTYLVDDDEAVVTVIFLGTLPPRRRHWETAE
jgi:mRNA-degrading endonuclease RelE of RelBE toxin-antitoxin system